MRSNPGASGYEGQTIFLSPAVVRMGGAVDLQAVDTDECVLEGEDMESGDDFDDGGDAEWIASIGNPPVASSS